MIDATTILQQLGQQVRSRRSERGWSRRDLARHTGISERFLADVETGKANPSIARLCTLANTFETTPAALLGGDAARPATPARIALLGLRGAGKSSVGAALGERLG
ncbi:MAG: helix-turn-helix domain-containing protein, partial [Planctomycetota bacterium]